MPLLLRHVASALAAILLLATPALAEKRVALVIGNGAYQHTERLPNPKNDAEDVSAALRRIGFETITGVDLDKAGMEDATIRFARAARTADIAIFYYSGHAMQFNGVNYLMPVDAALTDEADLRRMARIDDIVADLQRAKNLRILVLDACRDNPLAEQLRRRIGAARSLGIGRGLAKIDSPQGMILAFSTQAGSTAADGSGRNSPYTAAFLKHIEAAEEIGTVFRRVTADVYETTKRTQLPELSLSLIGEFYLRGRPVAAPPPGSDFGALQERLKALEDQLRKRDELKKDQPRKDDPRVNVVAPQPLLSVPAESRSKPTAADPSPPANVAPPLPPADPTLEARARRFLEDYMSRSQGDPSGYFDFLQRALGPVVLYYGKSVNRDAVVAEQRRHLERWPKRNFRLKPETVQIVCDSVESACRVSGDLDYRNENPARSQVATGTWHYEFRLVLSGPAPVIVEESGNTVSRAAGKKR